MDKSRSSSKTETENTVKLDTKKILSLASSDDKNMEEKQPKVITIKINKLARDNLSLSSVSVLGKSITTVSPDGYRIPRKKKRNYLHWINQGLLRKLKQKTQ